MSNRIGGAVNSGLRRVILGSSQSRPIKRVAARHGMRLGASRFVAGETLDACVEVLRGLNEKGLHANTTLLGEDVMDEAATEVVVGEYLRILERIRAEELRVNVAVKLTHLGLDLGEELAEANLRTVVERAAELGNFVRIDMEYSGVVEATLRIYRALRADGLDNVGVVLQSYLYRAPQDLEELLPLKPNLRLVKGAYLEPPSVAYPKKEDVDAAYVAMMETSLRGEGYTAIATHDGAMIDHAVAFTEREGIGRDRFEFQLLYGVRPEEQARLAAGGNTVRVYLPYGPQWYGYLMRRLAERPANLALLGKALTVKK